MISSHSLSFLLFLLISLISLSYLYPHTPTEYWYNAPIDHFDNRGDLSDTFPMRYIVNAQYWYPQQGPILFYAGNEGDIWGFYNNSGFMTDTLAQELNGLVVFAEHRFFGQSWPFDKEYAFTTENSTYLTVQ